MKSSIQTLQRGLLLKLSVLLLMLAALLGYSHRTVIGLIGAGREETEILNATGRQRMLVQQFVRQANLALIGLSISDWKTLLEQRKLSAETSADFEQSMEALLNGGETRLGATVVTLPRVESAEVRSSLNEIAAVWAEVKRASVKVLRSENSQLRDHPDLALMQSAATSLVERVDDTLLLMHRRGIERTDRLLRYQTGMLFGGLAVFLLVAVFVQRSIIKPLTTAHGGLLISEQRFRTLSESAPIGIFLTDTVGHALYLNPHCLGIMGASLEEALGDGWARSVHPADASAVFAEWKSISRAETAYNRELRFLWSNGEVHYVHVRTTPIRAITGEVTGHVGTVEDVTERKHSQAKLEKMHRELLETSRQAGMAEVATSVLHNVGNVLNSVNVSCSVVAEKVRKSRIGSVAKTASLLHEHADGLGAFLTSDPTGQKLPDFLSKLAGRLSAEQAEVLQELQALSQNIEHIKDIVAMQQNYAKISGVTETIKVTELVEDSLRMNNGALLRHDVQVIRDYTEVPLITVEKHKVLQVLVNLIRNAKYACDDSGRSDKQLAIRVSNGGDYVRIAVEDNGVGIPTENITRIFSHGFTTKKEGHGFGLHSGVLAAQEMGGRLTVHSDGPGTGATFTLELPLSPNGNQ